MSIKSSINVLLLSLSLGGGVMHSYVVSPIAFKNMSREDFGALQSKIFPLYFLGQAAVPALMGLTSPLALRLAGPLLGVSAVAGALNYAWILPVSHRIKEQKSKLIAEKRHEKIIEGNVEASDEMRNLNKQFGMYHGISSLLNLVSLVTLGVYGLALGKRIV